MSFPKKAPKRPSDNLSYRTAPATPKRRKLSTREAREDRAKSHAKLVLHAATAVLTSEQNRNPDYESEVRAITARTRKALDEGKTTHEAMRDVFALVFRADEPEEAAE